MLTALLYGLSDTLRRALDRRRARAALIALDDRLLKDIGLSRGDIPAVVEGLPPRGESAPQRPRGRAPAGARAPRPRPGGAAPDNDNRASGTRKSGCPAPGPA